MTKEELLEKVYTIAVENEDYDDVVDTLKGSIHSYMSETGDYSLNHLIDRYVTHDYVKHWLMTQLRNDVSLEEIMSVLDRLNGVSDWIRASVDCEGRVYQFRDIGFDDSELLVKQVIEYLESDIIN